LGQLYSGFVLWDVQPHRHMATAIYLHVNRARRVRTAEHVAGDQASWSAGGRMQRIASGHRSAYRSVSDAASTAYAARSIYGRPSPHSAVKKRWRKVEKGDRKMRAKKEEKFSPVTDTFTGNRVRASANPPKAEVYKLDFAIIVRWYHRCGLRPEYCKYVL
jgi:hypothetical protein